MLDGLTFGWRTALLTVAVIQLLAVAAALPRCLANRAANRVLAALLLVLAGILMPWLIGFAGFYDRWRWLTFAPFAITLAVAPLLYAYVHALTSGELSGRLRWHLAPAFAQFAFLTGSFLLPAPLKQRWDDMAFDPFNRATSLGTIIGLAAYGAISLRLLARYRQALAQQRSDDARYAARWLSRAVGATFLLLPVWAIYVVWDALSPLGYFALMGLHIAIAAFALFLAVEGWRHAALPFPTLAQLLPEPATPEPARDWQSQGATWAAQVRAANWAADPELSLATLARRLGTNTGYLSRALNEGLGLGFSAFVNGLRSEAVAAALDSGADDDLLTLALDAGFASKASFNRAFFATYGVTPSAYRRRAGASQIVNLSAEARI
jgi:AraC-like DNA-binding protein